MTIDTSSTLDAAESGIRASRGKDGAGAVPDRLATKAAAGTFGATDFPQTQRRLLAFNDAGFELDERRSRAAADATGIRPPR
jgi:hypothetical protein